MVFEGNATNLVQGVYFHCLSTEKLIEAGLGVSRTIYVNVDSPDLGFPYFNFLGGYQLKNTLYIFYGVILYDGYGRRTVDCGQSTENCRI